MLKRKNIILTIGSILNFGLIFIPMFAYQKNINPELPKEVGYASLFNKSFSYFEFLSTKFDFVIFLIITGFILLYSSYFAQICLTFLFYKNKKIKYISSLICAIQIISWIIVFKFYNLLILIPLLLLIGQMILIFALKEE